MFFFQPTILTPKLATLDSTTHLRILYPQTNRKTMQLTFLRKHLSSPSFKKKANPIPTTEAEHPLAGKDGLVGGGLLFTVQLLHFAPDELAAHARLAAPDGRKNPLREVKSAITYWGFIGVLLSFIEFYWVLLSFIGFLLTTCN